MDLGGLRYLVVGAGLWGLVLAERIASQLGEKVLVLDRRSHSGGNCYTIPDPVTGIERHAYGAHVFHSSSPMVWEYINRFTSFTSYRHRVFSEYRGRIHPLPLGLATINSFYGLKLKPWEMPAFIRQEIKGEAVDTPANLEEKIISHVGRPLYEAFVRGYTQKRWGRHPRELPPEAAPTLLGHTSYNTDYFDHAWQGMPEQGYPALFARLLRHPLINLELNVDYAAIADRVPAHCQILYSGPIDAFFGYSRGALEWRSLHFQWETVPYADYQGTAVINQADPEVPYTRVYEFKHLHPERGIQGKQSIIAYEYPKPCKPGEEPYYPVNTPENETLHAAYCRDAAEHPNIIFGGRLGSYKHMNMDKTIANALECFDQLCAKQGIGQ